MEQRADIEARKLNLIISGMNEADAGDTQDQPEDSLAFKELVDKHLGIKIQEPTVERVGEPDTEKP